PVYVLERRGSNPRTHGGLFRRKLLRADDRHVVSPTLDRVIRLCLRNAGREEAEKAGSLSASAHNPIAAERGSLNRLALVALVREPGHAKVAKLAGHG
ncbi:MAG: hypothetical protein OER77_09650, partial [Myxococcales bacterium]|nr:hypothetical protein [Myxococcales bacterium]